MWQIPFNLNAFIKTTIAQQQTVDSRIKFMEYSWNNSIFEQFKFESIKRLDTVSLGNNLRCKLLHLI